MAKLKRVTGDGLPYSYVFFCPGCDEVHQFFVAGIKVWTFNGDMDKPTFSPSLVNTKGNNSGYRCHLHLEGGKIKYCTDCKHELAGKTIELPELPEGWD